MIHRLGGDAVLRALICLAGAIALASAGCDDTGTTATPADLGVAADRGPPLDVGGEADVGDPTTPGAPCEGPADCPNGLCLATADGGRCTVPCDDATACPAGWACQDHPVFDGRVCRPTPECPDLDGDDRDGDGVVDPCDACPDEAADGPDGCPPPIGGLRLTGQVVGGAGPMRAGDYTLHLVGGAREPAVPMHTTDSTLRPLSLGRTR